MRFSTSMRWMWEFAYLLAVYFQVINNTAMFTVVGAINGHNNTKVQKTDVDALFAFGLISNVSAWITIALSTFRRSRGLVFPCMIFSTVMYLISMSIQTHLFLLAQVSMTEFWQFPLGWAACVIKIITCCTISFWDKNESEDKYTTTGYFGSLPVFPLSRCIIYISTGLLLAGCRGFILNFLIQTPNAQFNSFHIISIVASVFAVLVCGMVVIKPQKGLMVLFSLVTMGLAIGQAILTLELFNQNAALVYSGTLIQQDFQTKILSWMTGYSWAAFCTIFVGLVLTLGRSD